MEATSRTALEPLSEAGPEMPAAPATDAKNVVSPAAIGAAKAAEAAAKLTASTLQASAPIATPATAAMDRDFIARNQIVERYLSGKLPVKGATDFERFCHDNPQLLDELGLPERVNAGLRLLEASGKPEPWQEAPKRIWEKPQVAMGLGGAVLVLLIMLAIAASSASSKTHTIDKLKKQVAQQPLEPATSTRTIRLLPSRTGQSDSPAVVIGGGGSTQLADLKIDLSRSAFRAFRVTVDRVDQGRVMVLNNLLKDSNGHLRIALNSSALGPGNYQFTIEGLTWRGETVPDAWITVGVAR
jgi:hypothetical protein